MSFRPTSPMDSPCWRRTAFDSLTAGGSAVLSSRPGCVCVRPRAQTAGASAFERLVGADDEPERLPVGYLPPVPVAVPRKGQDLPPDRAPVRWAP